MKVLGNIALGLVVLLACLFFLLCSLCAVSGGPFAGNDRATFTVFALISLAVMIGALVLMAKLNRRPRPDETDALSDSGINRNNSA